MLPGLLSTLFLWIENCTAFRHVASRKGSSLLPIMGRGVPESRPPVVPSYSGRCRAPHQALFGAEGLGGRSTPNRAREGVIPVSKCVDGNSTKSKRRKKRATGERIGNKGNDQSLRRNSRLRRVSFWAVFVRVSRVGLVGRGRGGCFV